MIKLNCQKLNTLLFAVILLFFAHAPVLKAYSTEKSWWKIKKLNSDPCNQSLVVSTAEIRNMVLNDLDGFLNWLPTYNNLMEAISIGRTGVFRLLTPPTHLEVGDSFMYDGEIGFLKIRGQWIISLNSSNQTIWPIELQSIDKDEVADFDIHSHPGTDPESGVPAFDDTVALGNTKSGKAYISTHKGIIEFQKPQYLPGNYNFDQANLAFNFWILNDLKLTEEQYYIIGGWTLQEKFFKKFYHLRYLSIEEFKKILK
ncbi:MAG: hypothetical protein KDD40_04475 [Bdellovibrionales bacterium]|nr:hypothetical protein [Bdellovibrionales bacterium]